MKRRAPWLISGLLLILASATAAAATYLWWLPCRGQMLVGTPYGPEFQDSLLTRACTDRMNEGTPFPLPTAVASQTPYLLLLSTLTAVLIGAAWLVPVLVLPLRSGARLPAALPGLMMWLMAAIGIGTGLGTPQIAPMGVSALADLVIIAGLVAVVVCAESREVWLDRLRFVLLALAASIMTFGGMVADYVLMIRWSDAAWDSPPGSGYLSATLLLLCGLLLLLVSLLPARRSATTAAEQVEQVDAVA